MTFFYDLNKKLNTIRELPETTHKQLNERDMSRAAKGHEKYGKEGMQALAKAGREGKDLDKVRDKYNKYDEGIEDRLKDLDPKNPVNVPAYQRKAAEQGRSVKEAGGVPMTPKQKSFAKLAPPADKITFADKIAGAKKEVDEMLGDVAAEAMKAALGKGKQPTMGEATKEIPGGRRHTSEPGGYGRKDDEEAPKVQTQRGRGRPKKNADSETGQVMKPDWSAFGVGKVNLPKHKGAVTKHKMVGENVAGAAQQIYDELADIRAVAKQAQRGGEFPQGFATRLESSIWSAMQLIQSQQPGDAQVREEEIDEKAVSKKQQRFMGMVHAAKKGEKPASKEVAKTAKSISAKEADKFASTKHKGLPEKAKEDTDTRDTKAEKAGKRVTKDIEYDEKAKDGDHGKKRGPQDAKAEKAGKKVAKDIEHDEKVDENTTSGSVATAPAGGGKKSSGGFAFGGGIYDSMNRDLENMIAESMTRLDESMSINMSMNSESPDGQGKSLTITATGEDADRLAMMLKLAGVGDDHSHAYADAPDMVDENKPDWPTNTETSDDAFQYSGGLNKPKRDVAGDGQATGQVTAVSSVDDEGDDDLDRMMEMAGIKKKEVDEGYYKDPDGDDESAEDREDRLDDEKRRKEEEQTDEGNKFTGNLAKARAAGKKEADLDGDGDMEKVQESIFDLQRLWKAYKG
jgi:Protein of unknwon function (DUF3008)